MRFCGKVGYVEFVEAAPGVYEEKITERQYRGTVLRNARRLDATEKLHDDIDLNNSISIVADAYAYRHMQDMLYVVFHGSKWRITNIEVVRPRLNLTVGGIYNGPSRSVP